MRTSTEWLCFPEGLIVKVCLQFVDNKFVEIISDVEKRITTFYIKDKIFHLQTICKTPAVLNVKQIVIQKPRTNNNIDK